MKNPFWTEEQIDRLVAFGRTGMSWAEVAKEFREVSQESCRRTWHDVSTSAERKDRDSATTWTRMIGEVLATPRKRRKPGDTGFPADVQFDVDPIAEAAEYGRVPMRQTMVYRESTTAIAALDID